MNWTLARRKSGRYLVCMADTTNTSINYEALERQKVQEIQDDLQKKLSQATKQDLGRVDGLRYTILSLVVDGRYNAACKELETYVEVKTEYKVFQHRAQKYIRFCQDVIRAIETKRNFPGLAAMSLSKQQEIYDRVIIHFDELKKSLQRIERIEREYKLSDVRSTMWVVRVLLNVVIFFFFFSLVQDLSGGVSNSFRLVFDAATYDLTSKVINLLGL